MATDWYMEGPWIKNCNCDPGCPCDFNVNPTHGYCEGMVAMKIEKGHFGDVDLSGLCWGGVVHWPGPIHEGNGVMQPFIDATANESQLEALAQALSGEHGDTLFQILSAVCPTVHDPIVEPIEFEFDIDARTARVRVGDGVVETESETMRGIDPPDPYRVIVKIPNGFEYTGPDESAETAKATRIVSRGAVKLDLSDSHSSLAWVRHGGSIQTRAHPAVAVD